jgi:hypothetical protein
MFEPEIERHWFGNLAKRATPAAAPAKISPMLAYAAGCEEQEIAALHEANQRSARAPQQDPEAALLEKSVLRMHGLQPGGDAIIRKAALAILLDQDLEKVSRLPGRVTLENRDGGPLHKFAHADDVRKDLLRSYMERQIDEAREGEFATTAELELMQKCVPACDMNAFREIYGAIIERAA